MTVYVDTLFLTNGLVDYLLLLLTGRVLGLGLGRRRLGLAAALGGCYAVGCFLPWGQWLCQWPVKVGWGFLLVLVSYGWQRRLARCYGVFLGLSCALGGGLMALELVGGQLTMVNGVVFTPLDLKAVLLWTAVCWWGMSLVFRGLGRYSRLRGEVIPITITRSGRSIVVSALVDTGNGLKDPATGGGVVLLEWQQALVLLPHLTEHWVRHPAEALLQGDGVPWRVISYRAVGTEGGLLLAFPPDEVSWQGERRGETLVALTAQPLPEGTTALVAPEEGRSPRRRDGHTGKEGKGWSVGSSGRHG